MMQGTKDFCCISKNINIFLYTRFMKTELIGTENFSASEHTFSQLTLPDTPLKRPTKKNIAKTPTVVSLFSGCGGMDLAFRDDGFDIVWANDINQYACETYRRYLGSHIVFGDIEKIPIKPIPKPASETVVFPSR